MSTTGPPVGAPTSHSLGAPAPTHDDPAIAHLAAVVTELETWINRAADPYDHDLRQRAAEQCLAILAQAVVDEAARWRHPSIERGTRAARQVLAEDGQPLRIIRGGL